MTINDVGLQKKYRNIFSYPLQEEESSIKLDSIELRVERFEQG